MNDKNPFFLGRSELTCIILHFSVVVNVFARSYWLQTMSRRQPKVFWSSNFSKMLARCGRVAHICEANQILQSVFPAAIAFFKTVKFIILWFIRNELQIQTRQRGNCSTLAGKSRGGTPFCRTLKIGFPKRSSPRNTTWIWFGKAGAHPQLALGSQLPLKPCILIAASRLKRQLRFFAILS